MKRLLAIAVLLAVASPASAHDHRPPRTTLRHDGRSLQRGLLITYCWAQHSDGHHAVGGCADGVDRFEEMPAHVPADEEIAIRIGNATRPRSISLRSYPTANDSPVGYQTGEDVPFRLERRGDAWHIVFALSGACSHHYLRFSAVWPDVVSKGSQDAYYTFHALTTASALGDLGAPLCAVVGSL